MDAKEHRHCGLYRWMAGAWLLGALAIGIGACSGSDSSPASSPLPGIDAGLDATDASQSADVFADSPLEASEDAAPIPTDPMGPVFLDNGVSFRLWAPSAKSVDLEGEFTTAPLPMTAEPGGLYSLVVPQAKAGQRYRYRIHQQVRVLERLDPRGRAIDSSWSKLVNAKEYAWQTAPMPSRAKRDWVVYELHVGGFNSPTSGASGTFASVMEKLDDLADLGINAIELMPSNQYGGDQGGWGYNPQAYFAPKTQYGSPDDLRRLVDAAHAKGIAVLLDLVYNHYDGWTGAPLYCFDGQCSNVWAGIYFFSDSTYAYTPWGPRPDYQNPQVASFLLDGIRTWVEEYRIDGFRWDSTSNIRGIDGEGAVPGGKELLRNGNELAHRLNPNFFSIAEDLKGKSELTRPLSDADGLGFDAQWDGFAWDINRVIVGESDSARDMASVRNALLGSYNDDPFQRLIYVESHDFAGNDNTRLASRIDSADPGSWAARKRSMLAATALMTAPGVPMLFMGQEFLERGEFTDPPKALDWSKEESYGPVRQYHKDLIRLRRNQDGTTAGLKGSGIEVYHVNDADKVIAFRRWEVGGDDVVVVLNFKNKAYERYDIGFPQGGTWHVRLNSDRQDYSTDFTNTPSGDVQTTDESMHGQPARGGIALGPYSALILSR